LVNQNNKRNDRKKNQQVRWNILLEHRHKQIQHEGGSYCIAEKSGIIRREDNRKSGFKSYQVKELLVLWQRLESKPQQFSRSRITLLMQPATEVQKISCNERLKKSQY
jgi:hypothetical protein